ncbi:hypothetical protein [Thiohalobacter thiocyanaticus]|uniref:Uncharacterized protein n=1 Tax=Thiohalobacter thiocyanaticus TaxID=585455 RepID=A0A426QHL0_9GAMM|nr:hypothetical protein [Thiohalobacter thiocyanaticus]RRQ21248.1 hypothetical protein D6C00_04290 [Thiohalobacter thiocyanaticus]
MATAALVFSANAAAWSFSMDFKGYMTLLTPEGEMVRNTSFADEPRFQGYRSPINGTMVMTTNNQGMSGSATFEPFPFFGVEASGRDITFVSTDNLLGIPTNTLLLGNMLFDWSGNNGIPVSLVLDMGNLTTALMNSSPGDVIRGVMTPPTDNTVITLQDGSTTTMPVGPAIVATTTWNTTDVDTDSDGEPGPLQLGVNPSGTTPLLYDTVIDKTNGDIGLGGSPMRTPPFMGFNANFDIVEITVTCVSLTDGCEVPVPEVPLSAEPLKPLLDTAGGLFP